MKMHFTKWIGVCSALVFLATFSFNTQNANAQVLIQEGFDATTTPSGWLYTGFARIASPNAPCEGAGSLRRNLWSSAQTGSVAAPIWTSNGESINVTFDFKLLNYQFTLSPANVGTPIPGPGWGELRLQLSTDGGANYTTVFTINDDNYSPSVACSEYGHTIDGSLVPSGSSLRVRWFGQWTAGDYYMYIDEVTIQQEGTFDCPLQFANIGDPCNDGDPFTNNDTINEDCVCEGTPIVFNGCITGNSFSSLNPACFAELNLPGAWTNEFTPVTVVEGSVYTFSLSNPNYFVTITTTELDVLTFAQQTVAWTADFSGTVRFFSHAGFDCPNTTGTPTAHTRTVSRSCVVDCEELQANFGDPCTLEGFFDTTINGDCECEGTPFDCDLGEGQFVNIGDPCSLPGSGDSYSETVATEALGTPNTFDANPAYTITVPAGLEGNYQLSITADGSVFGGSWRSEFRVQILDPNGVNVTNGAPGGAADEWQPSVLSQGGDFEGSLNLDVTDPSGEWTVLVRLSLNEGPQINANVDITLAFEPGDFESTIGENCACITPEPPFEGCLTADFVYGNLNPACGETANSPADAYTNELSTVEVVAGDEYVFFLSNPDYYVTVASVDGDDITILAAGQASVSLTAPADGTLLFFSHIDAECSLTSGFATSHTRSVTRTCTATFDCPDIFANIGDPCDDGNNLTTGTTIDADCECTGGTAIVFEGCTTGFAYGPLNPVCGGPQVNSPADAYTVEYSLVTIVDAGVQYTFFTSNPDYFVTVTNGDGSEILAFGESTVTYTPPAAGLYRMYSHAGPDCPSTSGPATSHTRSILPGDCNFECLVLEANIGDPCTLEGFFDTTVSGDCECVGTAFDCDLGEGAFANFGDPCAIAGEGDSFSATVSTETLGSPNTFEDNAQYTISVPASLTGSYDLTIDAAGSVFNGSWRNEFRVQILDANGNNVTDGAPGGLADEWQPSALSQGGDFTGSLTLSGIENPAGDWTVRVRLSFDEGPQINAEVDITLSFEPAGTVGVITEDCACEVPCESEGGTLSFAGSNTICLTGDEESVSLSGVVLTGNAGDNSLWVLTPANGFNVLATDASGPNFELLGTPEGAYRLWHISYANGLDINSVLANPNTGGCWDVSNPLRFIITSQPEIGTIATNGAAIACSGDGVTSFITASYSGPLSSTNAWILTDADGNLLDTRANNSRFNLGPLAPGTYFIYYVGVNTPLSTLNSLTNINDAGSCLALSNGIEVTTVDCSGGALLSSQPNPTNGPSWVSFEVDKAQQVQLEVYDLSGRHIKTLFHQNAEAAHAYTMQFDGSGLPNGVYIYRLTTQNEVVVDKFMIAR